jgi:hypothetical protein
MASSVNADTLAALHQGPLHWFSDWPTGEVPSVGPIVYTIWNRDGAFIYVGMAGRNGISSAKPKGPFGRLESHASGRRSGNQFCIYVCDRFVLPRVHNRIAEIAEGKLSLDRLTREFIRTELGFKFMPVEDSAKACQIERLLQRGEWDCGRPFLNPLPSR